jgi:hypothetical protein
MSYPVTHLEYPQERYNDMIAWTDGQKDAFPGIDDMQSVDVFPAGPGKSVVVAAYDDEESYNAASETVGDTLRGMAQFLTSPPATSLGTVDRTTRS